MKKQKKDLFAYTAPICTILGLLLILGAVGVNILDYYNEKKLLSTVEAITQEKTQKTGESTAENTLGDSKEVEDGEAEELEAEELSKLIGVMRIPAIEMEAVIRAGTNTNTLRASLGHLEKTANIGETQGNCVIAGHRNYSFGRFFNRLDEVKIGDNIVITADDGTTYTYEVKETSVVEPEDVSVLTQTDEPLLTLVTCTPIYIASHRLIVTAELINTE